MNKTIEQRAAKEYGITQSVFNAGYMLKTGEMLDFSEGGDMGRCQDHRNIAQFFHYNPAEYAATTKQMIKFINRGNIRIMPESASIEFSIMPNKSQLYSIREIEKDFRSIGKKLTIEKSKGNCSELIGNYQALIQYCIK